MTSIKLMLTLALFFPCLVHNADAQQADTGQALDKGQQAIVTISAFTATGDLVQLGRALNEGLDAGLTVNEIKEVLVQLYAYAGFPRSLNAISTLESVLKDRTLKGVNDAEGRPAVRTTTGESKYRYGKSVQTKLTGSTATGAPQRFVPIIDTFLKEHLFADIFGRTILDFKTREIVTISALASMNGVEPQLRSHFNVGLNIGLTEAQLKGIVSVLGEKVGNKEGAAARSVLWLTLNNKKGRQDSPANANKTLSKAEDQELPTDTVFPRGTQVTNNNFTGIVWVNMLVNNDSTFNTSVGNVTFAPGARSNWHYHPGGQLLLVTGGNGRYQEKGGAVKQIRKGDVIKCAPNVIHWHGAAPDSEMSHIAIGTNPGKGAVVWLQPVSDAEYNSDNR